MEQTSPYVITKTKCYYDSKDELQPLSETAGENSCWTRHGNHLRRKQKPRQQHHVVREVGCMAGVFVFFWQSPTSF